MASPSRTHRDPTGAGGDFDARDVVRSLSHLSDAIRVECAAAVRAETARTQSEAFRRARWPGTGKYREAIRSKVFDEGNGTVAGKVFVIQGIWHRDADRASGRLRSWPKNLPLWLEYGTVTARAKPHLIPAFEAGKARLNEAVRQILQRAGRS